jgi:hypothetical protein
MVYIMPRVAGSCASFRRRNATGIARGQLIFVWMYEE